jgi:hypothetical protein
MTVRLRMEDRYGHFSAVSGTHSKCSKGNSFVGCAYGSISGMKIGDLTKKQWNSVPCPTCGVPTGRRCLLFAGGPRLEPHTDRKLIAAEAVGSRKKKS